MTVAHRTDTGLADGAQVIFEPADEMQMGFLATGADIAIFGGKAGTGKTGAALIATGQHVDLPGYGGVIFRRLTPELFGAGSVWSQSRKFYPALGGTPVRTPHAEWRFPSGASIEFLGLQHPGDEEGHQGKRYTCVTFEEVTQFTAEMFWFLFGRIDDLVATQDGPTWKKGDVLCKGHLRATCNPDADSFVRELVDWWIDEDGFAIVERAGVLRWFLRDPHKDGDDKATLLWFDTREEAQDVLDTWEPDPDDKYRRPFSLTFFPGIPSPHMGKTYQSRLGSLSYVKRERMKRGNWNIREEAGNILRREWFPVIDRLPSPALREVRGWDKGAVAGGDATAGAKVVDLGTGNGWAIVDIAESRGTPGERKTLMTTTAMSDDATVTQGIWQDPGAAGVYDAEQTARDMAPRHVLIERAAKGKVAYAETWAALAEAGHRGDGPRIYVLRAPWNDRLFGMMDAFDGREGGDDDWIDAISRAFLELSKGAAAGDALFVPLTTTKRYGFH